jgi:hypothetical protein
MIKKIPRNKRVGFAPRMVLTERDKRIILAVYENRYMSRDQIRNLFFNVTSMANERLMRLYQHGYLDRLYPPVSFGSTQAVYGLDRKGAELVAKELGIAKESINWKKRNSKVEFLFLEHTLAVSEFRVCLELAAREARKIEVLFWKPQSKALNDRVPDPERQSKYLLVSPDAFFGILTTNGLPAEASAKAGKAYFFLEADLGTESTERFKKKIIAYRNYWKSGKYQEKYGFKSFRVLTVTTSEKRLNNLVAMACDCGAKGMFLFTTQDLTKPNNVFDNVWLTPTGHVPMSILS